jgi:hypothetical protein
MGGVPENVRIISQGVSAESWRKPTEMITYI